jgi:hypothetical protein
MNSQGWGKKVKNTPPPEVRKYQSIFIWQKNVKNGKWKRGETVKGK